ncbi:uncharacterized protein RAG0_06754 [Rhynchosporium agropyri]|uniref:Uncharacterized protein n=1 Tax=Rhynchosporium agropyri TaxID=914238 RepID=A0A1E1KIP7_9HELO|nr:uncharacterized protein RAG0_06754 [Rhynchosporium agropyri]
MSPNTKTTHGRYCFLWPARPGPSSPLIRARRLSVQGSEWWRSWTGTCWDKTTSACMAPAEGLPKSTMSGWLGMVLFAPVIPPSSEDLHF